MVWDGDECVLASWAECDDHSDCSGGCNLCINCTCQVDAEGCMAECDVCNLTSRECEDDDDLCDDCYECNNGTCEDSCEGTDTPICDTETDQCVECIEDPDCEDYEYCREDNTCACTNCYAWVHMPPIYLNGECPECDNDEGGCYSSAAAVPWGYDMFSGSPPADGEVGLCDNPSKTDTIGYHTYCVESLDDAMWIKQIVIDLIELGNDLSTIDSCLQCVTTGQPLSCGMCLAGLFEGDLIDQPPCYWVDECVWCPSTSLDCAWDIEDDVVDWDTINSQHTRFCYPGADWP